MSEKIQENNKVTLVGEIIKNFTFSHEALGEGFYLTTLRTNRLSDQTDEIPLMVSERLMDIHKDYRGMLIEIYGQFRSYNRHEGERNHLMLYVFAQGIYFPQMGTDIIHTNHIHLDGFLCKTPVYRETPLGREISDMLLAVNRPYGKSDYIPCIAWGRNARYASCFDVGSHLCIRGRIQSREYTKRPSETETEKRIACEVSVSELEILE